MGATFSDRPPVTGPRYVFSPAVTIPEAVVREWVGHVDLDILRLYTQIASSASQEAMRRFARQPEGIFKEGGGQPER